MKTHRRIALTSLLAWILSLSVGCAHLPGGIAASTTPINGRSYTEVGHRIGSDSYILLLGLIPIQGSNYVDAALRDALAGVDRDDSADALIEVTVTSHFQWWVLFTRFTIEVHGIGIQFD